MSVTRADLTLEVVLTRYSSKGSDDDESCWSLYTLNVRMSEFSDVEKANWRVELLSGILDLPQDE